MEMGGCRRRADGAASSSAAEDSMAWSWAALFGALLDLAIAYVALCVAAASFAASQVASAFTFPFRLLFLVARLPSYAVNAFVSRSPLSVLRTPPRTVYAPDGDEDEGSGSGSSERGALLRRRWHRGDRREAELDSVEGLRRLLEEEQAARVSMQQELEKERASASSATEEAMAMIQRLQKEKAALEIEVRQHLRMADEKTAFDREEMEELKDIIIRRERETRALEMELEEAYQQLRALTSGADLTPASPARPPPGPGDISGIQPASIDEFNAIKPNQQLPKLDLGRASWSDMESPGENSLVTAEVFSEQSSVSSAGRLKGDPEISEKGAPGRLTFEDLYGTGPKEGVETDALVLDVHVVDDKSWLKEDPNLEVELVKSGQNRKLQPNVPIQRSELENEVDILRKRLKAIEDVLLLQDQQGNES